MIGKSLTSSEIHLKDRAEQFLLKVNFFIYIRRVLFSIKNVPTDSTSDHTVWINSLTSNKSGKIVFYKIHVLNHTYQVIFLIINNSTKELV